MALKWERSQIVAAEGEKHHALAPVIISASRSTDIPAFHAAWFMRRLKAGYVAWTNPFNQKTSYVSFDKTRALVFWSKNPRPLIPYLDAIDDRGLGYYFQFTVNDYEAEGIEARVPPLAARIETFKALSERLSRARVIWRFDPLILLPGLGVDGLIERVARVGEALVPYTDKLVFSFVDIDAYRKVKSKLLRETKLFDPESLAEAEPKTEARLALAEGLAALARGWRRENPAFQIATCAEEANLEAFEIHHNKCIDDDLLAALYPEDAELMRFLGRETVSPEPASSRKAQVALFGSEDLPATTPTPAKDRAKGRRKRSLKDTGQRKACGCIFSKDIGAYNTCGHLCAYCYANTSSAVVDRNLKRRRVDAEGILG